MNVGLRVFAFWDEPVTAPRSTSCPDSGTTGDAVFFGIYELFKDMRSWLKKRWQVRAAKRACSGP